VTAQLRGRANVGHGLLSLEAWGTGRNLAVVICAGAETRPRECSDSYRDVHLFALRSPGRDGAGQRPPVFKKPGSCRNNAGRRSGNTLMQRRNHARMAGLQHAPALAAGAAQWSERTSRSINDRRR